MPVMGLASIGLTGTPGWNLTTPARPCMRVHAMRQDCMHAWRDCARCWLT